MERLTAPLRSLGEGTDPETLLAAYVIDPDGCRLETVFHGDEELGDWNPS